MQGAAGRIAEACVRFGTATTPNSSMRRVQRLIAEYELDTNLIAKLILKLIFIFCLYTRTI